jgi:hypothetical protein
MSALIHLITSDAEAHERSGAEDSHAVGELTPAMERTLAELAERLPATTTLYVARDWERCYFALVEDTESRFPLGDVFALMTQGAIGHGGVNIPRYYDTVAEFIASIPVSAETVCEVTEGALDAFWAHVAEHMPSVPSGDMAPGECDPLESNARQTVARWVTNNHPKFQDDDDRARTNAFIASVRLRAS